MKLLEPEDMKSIVYFVSEYIQNKAYRLNVKLKADQLVQATERVSEKMAYAFSDELLLIKKTNEHHAHPDERSL